MAKLMSPDKFIYDRKYFTKMKNYPNESFIYYNKAIIWIANDIYKEGVISPLRKSWMNDTNNLYPEQIAEIKKIAEFLLKNKNEIKTGNLQSSKNFGALFKLGRTSYGNRLFENLGDLKNPKLIDWQSLFEKLLQQNFDFENSKLLEDYVEIGAKLEEAFNKTNTLKK